MGGMGRGRGFVQPLIKKDIQTKKKGRKKISLDHKKKKAHKKKKKVIRRNTKILSPPSLACNLAYRYLLQLTSN